MLSRRAAVGLLLAPFAILAIEWGLRAPPSEGTPCGEAGPKAVREAWVSGVAPAAFLTGCVCLVIVVRISAMRHGGRASEPTLVAAAAWLALAIAWWTGGESSPGYLLGALAYMLLFPALIVAAALLGVIAARRSWTAVSGLAWLLAIAVVPGFVAVVETWGTDFYC